MSEENRNRKLVRARKKLKEFQKKRTSALSPGAKDTKNIKNGGSPKRTTLGGCSTPELKEFQKKRAAALSPGAKDTKNIKNGGSPKTTTLGGCSTPELKEFQKKRAAALSPGAKDTKNIKNGGSPKTTTLGGCSTPELKEFQKKRAAALSPGAKDTKNIKNGGSPKTTTLGGCSTPEIQDILKVLVSNFNCSNGVVLSALDKWKVHKDHTAPIKETAIDSIILESGSVQATPESEDDDTSSSDSFHSLNSDEPFIYVKKETSQNCDTNGINSTNDENQSLSSTESLRQISQQLTGLVSQSSFINTKDRTSTAVEDPELPSINTKDVTSTNTEDLELLLTDTKHVTSTDVEDLELSLTNAKGITSTDVYNLEEKQNEDLKNLRENDKKEFETKIAQEEGCLRHQLEVHIQTIGILISEKSDLRSALYHTQNAVKAKTGELEDVAAHLKASQQRVEKLERAISAVAKEKNILNKYKKELLKERDSLLVQVLKQSCTNETLTKKNVELERELQTVENDLKTLREELDAPECKIQQDSEQFSLEPTDDENNAVLKDQVEQLSKKVLNLKEEKELSLAKIQELESQLTVLKEEKGSLKNEERLHAELDCLKKQLSDQRNDYEMMILQYQSREHHLHELEHVEERWRELESLRPAILETLEASQNGDLKDQLKELQESFVKLTNDKLELTNTLQAEQHIKKELTKKIDELQKNVEELKKMVKTKNTQVENLQEERDLYYRYLQLYIVTYQQYAVLYQHLISDQGTLHKINQELQRTQEKLATVEERNQQLEAQIRDLAIPREGEDMLVKDADVAPSVLNSQGALAVMSQKEQAQHGGQEPDVEVRDRPNPEPSPSEVKDNVLGEKYRVLQEAMEKLQGRFIDVMKDKVELQERLEYLEHRCIQLPGKSASIGDYAALYLNNRAQLKEHHQAKEEGIGPVAQHKDDVKVKTSEAVLKLMNKNYEREQNPLLQSETTAASHAAPETSAPRDVELTSKVNQGEARSANAPILKTGQKMQFLLWNVESNEDSVWEQTEEAICVPFFYHANPKGSPLKIFLT